MPLAKVYRLLETGPVVLFTTMNKGKPNVMTMSWHTMMEFEPPLVGCVVSRNDFSYEAMRKTRQCVLNMPTADLAAQVAKCGNTSCRDVGKFETTGVTTLQATLVAAPLIAECFANLECLVADTRFMNRYDFFVLEVLKAWIEPGHENPRTLHHRGHGMFMIAGDTISLPSRMK